MESLETSPGGTVYASFKRTLTIRKMAVKETTSILYGH